MPVWHQAMAQTNDYLVYLHTDAQRRQTTFSAHFLVEIPLEFALEFHFVIHHDWLSSYDGLVPGGYQAIV